MVVGTGRGPAQAAPPLCIEGQVWTRDPRRGPHVNQRSLGAARWPTSAPALSGAEGHRGSSAAYCWAHVKAMLRYSEMYVLDGALLGRRDSSLACACRRSFETD